MLVRRGYHGATFERAVTAPPSSRTLAVTFDDGYRSVLTHARPILERLGLPATVFVPTDFVGATSPMRGPGSSSGSAARTRTELRGRCRGSSSDRCATPAGRSARTRARIPGCRSSTTRACARARESRRACEERLGALPHARRAVRGRRRTRGRRRAGGRLRRGRRAAGPGNAERRRGRASASTRRPRAARFAVKVARPVRRLRGSALARPLEAAARIAARGR